LTERENGMADDLSETSNGKGRKRVAIKPVARPAVAKVKSTIHLSVEASQRLDIHATMMGFDRSALVEKLINDHLRRYVVSDRRGSAGMASDEEAA
jgi:predicted transcriptional regulator